jgi:hypothetical protein
MAAQAIGRSETGAYEVRPFDAASDDRAGFLDLYAQVFGGGSTAWFDWKYVDDPYTDHVPVILALHGGTVVGAKAGMPFELATVDGRTLPALQPCDTMVHPDHRRQGLYSRMTELMTDHYADREVALLFNFPNSATLAGSLKHGWRTVRRVPTFYRVQDASAFVGADRGLGALVDIAADVHLSARTALVDAPASHVRVERHATPPPSLLATVAANGRPDRLHADRTEAFYEWRLDNPAREYTAYVASRDGSPRAAAVVGTDPEDPTRTAEVVELTPLAPRATEDGTVRAMLTRLIADHEDARAVAVSGLGLPADILRSYGFLSDLSPPVSAVADPTTLVAYPLSDDPALDAVHDPDGWTLRGLEQDTR